MISLMRLVSDRVVLTVDPEEHPALLSGPPVVPHMDLITLTLFLFYNTYVTPTITTHRPSLFSLFPL